MSFFLKDAEIFVTSPRIFFDTLKKIKIYFDINFFLFFYVNSGSFQVTGRLLSRHRRLYSTHTDFIRQRGIVHQRYQALLAKFMSLLHCTATEIKIVKINKNSFR